MTTLAPLPHDTLVDQVVNLFRHPLGMDAKDLALARCLKVYGCMVGSEGKCTCCAK